MGSGEGGHVGEGGVHVQSHIVHPHPHAVHPHASSEPSHTHASSSKGHHGLVHLLEWVLSFPKLLHLVVATSAIPIPIPVVPLSMIPSLSSTHSYTFNNQILSSIQSIN